MSAIPTCTTASTPNCLTRQFDMDAYLRRLRISSLAPDPEDILRTLHRAHATTIPFENIDVLLGRGIDLSPEAIQDKLLRRRRGGYCFEQNLLIADALERLDFRVMRMVARVHPDDEGLKTHLLVAAKIRDRWWLVDVGFGSHFRDAIPLAPGTSRQGEWTYRLNRCNETWFLETLQQGEWTSLYAFRFSPLLGSEISDLNRYTSTHPASPFVQRLIAFRMHPNFKYQLVNREFRIVNQDGSFERFELGIDQIPVILKEAFGIELDPTEENQLKKCLSRNRSLKSAETTKSPLSTGQRS